MRGAMGITWKMVRWKRSNSMWKMDMVFFPFVSLYRLAFMENDKNTANTVVLV